MSNNPAVDSGLASLEDYIEAIRERFVLVIAVTVLGGALAWLVASSGADTYEAEGRVLIGPSPVGSVNANLVAPNLERERLVLGSVATAEAALENVTPEVTLTPIELLENLNVSFQPQSDALVVQYLDEDPEVAASIVNAMIVAYVDRRETGSREFFETQISTIQARIAADGATIDEIDANLEELRSERATVVPTSATGPVRIAAIDSELSVLTTLRSEIVGIRTVDLRSLRELESSQEVRPTAAELLQPARVPTSPTGISSTLLILGGLIGGLGFGVVAAFLLHRLDRSVRNEGDVEATLRMAVLASIPRFGFRVRPGQHSLVMSSDSSKRRVLHAREEYRRLRSSVLFLAVQQDLTVITVSSALPGEGKSTTIANLGVALAQSGKNTAIVSADLRRPSLDRVFGVEDGPGLSEWLGGDDSIDLLTHSDIENLTIINAGGRPHNASELLTSARAAHLFNELRTHFDIVLIDSPPVLATADLFSLLPHSDAMLLVVDVDRADTRTLAKVRYQLDRVGAPLVGAIRNRERARGAVEYGRDTYLSRPRDTAEKAEQKAEKKAEKTDTPEPKPAEPVAT